MSQAMPALRDSGRVVAARIPGVAPQHPPDPFGEPPEESVFLQGTDRVAATTGLEAADGTEGGEDGAEGELIGPDGQDEQADDEPGGPGPGCRGVHGGAFAARGPRRRATARARSGRARRAWA